MKPRILRAFPFAVLTSFTSVALLAACDQIGKPSAAEAGATKLAEVSAKARKLTARIASSPEAAGTPQAAEGETATAGGDRQMLAPTEAAEELRKLASIVKSVGDGDSQRKQSAALAQRLYREAAVLDLMALERVESRMQALAAIVISDLATARLISESAGPDSLKAAETAVQVTRSALDRDRKGLEMVRADTETQAARLGKLEAEAKAANAEADQVAAAAEVLRIEVNTSTPSAARPKMAQAVERKHEAIALRKDAAMKERDVTADKGIVRAKVAAVEAVEKSNEWLAGRLTEAEKAKTSATARTQGAARSASELRKHAETAMEELAKVSKTEFQPLLDSAKEAFEGNLATKIPTDAASLGICKARLYILAASNAAITIKVGKAIGGGQDAVAQLKTDQDKWLAQAKSALIEARDALSGASSEGAPTLLATIEEFGAALGMDLSQPAPAAPASSTAAPAEEPVGGESKETEAPAPKTKPAEPPPSDPPSSDPPAKEPEPDEPNK